MKSTTKAFRPVARWVATIGAIAGLMTAAVASPVLAEPNFAPVKYLAALNNNEISSLPAYSALSCVSSTCVATGPNWAAEGSGFGTPATMSSASGVWSGPTALSLPSGHIVQTANDWGASDGLSSVSCWQVGYCAAVGDYGNSVNFGPSIGDLVVPAPMAALEIAGTWQAAVPVAMPSLPGMLGVLSAVSCVSTGDCTAVGFYESYDATTGALVRSIMTVTETGGVWSTAVNGANITGSPVAFFPDSISCVDTSDCTYEVTVNFHATFQAFAVQEIAGTWGSPVDLAAPATKTFDARSISCSSSNSCVVVGQDADNSGGLLFGVPPVPAFAIETAGVWGHVGQLPQPRLSPPSSGGLLNGVDCVSSTLCVAVGDARTDPFALESVPMAVTLSNGKWSSEALYAAPILAGSSRAKVAALDSVSCVATTYCTALGLSQNGDVLSDVNDYTFSVAINPVLTPGHPASPFGVRATVSREVATVSWNAPFSDGGSVISTYLVTATSPGLAKHECLTTGLTCRIGGLAKGHKYHLTVQSRNAVGFSTPSLPCIVVAK